MQVEPSGETSPCCTQINKRLNWGAGPLRLELRLFPPELKRQVVVHGLQRDLNETRLLNKNKTTQLCSVEVEANLRKAPSPNKLRYRSLTMWTPWETSKECLKFKRTPPFILEGDVTVCIYVRTLRTIASILGVADWTSLVSGFSRVTLCCNNHTQCPPWGGARGGGFFTSILGGNASSSS